MERIKTGGALANCGKEWKCYIDSTLAEIKELNKGLTDQEIETVFDIVQSINEQEKEYGDEKTSRITE